MQLLSLVILNGNLAEGDGGLNEFVDLVNLSARRGAQFLSGLRMS